MEIVNGYVCHDCTDTALAARNIDPAHPKDGPFGRDKPQPTSGDPSDPAVVLDGRLKGQPVEKAAEPVKASGTVLDLSA